MDHFHSLQGDRRVTLEHLRAFVAVAETGGFQRASEQLHRTQSAITQSLSKLETILGSRLLIRRQGHIVGLTPEGERLLPLVRNMLVRLDMAITTFREPPMEGRIRLGVPDDFQLLNLQRVVAQCRSKNPALRVEVSSALSSELLQRMQQKRLDLIVYKHTDSALDMDGLGETLWREPLYWVGGESVAFDSLAELPLVCFPNGCAYRKVALEALSQHGKPSYRAYESASYENVRSAIMAGLGIGVLPRSAVGHGHKVLTREEGFPELPEVQLTLMMTSRDAALLQFAELIKDAVALGAQR